MLREQQDAIFELLKDSADVDCENIIAENRKDLVNAIKTAMAKLGMCIVVQTLDVKISTTTPGPVYDSMKVSILVNEHPLINRAKTDLTALDLAEKVAAALHLQRVENRTLTCTAINYQQDSIYLTYAVDFDL